MEGSQDADAATGPALQPTQVDNNVVSEGWAAVGGHAAVIQQLKEMVLLPLQYPEVFNHMGITPPRYQMACLHTALHGSLSLLKLVQ